MGRKKYSKEFKLEAVRLSNQEDVTAVQVAEELGIRVKQLYNWRKELRESGVEAFPGEGKSGDEELSKLRRELRRVQQERDILKKAMSVFAQDESRSMHS